MTNYIPDTNLFNLAGPPKWFLNQLWHFDASLVIVPSRQGFFYRLAQRRKPDLSSKIVNTALFNESDTKMLASYSLIPVTTIVATANWSNPYIFEELRRRNVSRMGGAEAYNKQLDIQDAQTDIDKQSKIDEHLTYLSKDSWNLYKKKIGLRSHMYSPKAKSQ